MWAQDARHHNQPTPLEAAVMKYVLLIYQAIDFDPMALSEREHQEVAAQYAAVTATPNLRPGLTTGFPRAPVTVRVLADKPATTPGHLLEPTGGGYDDIKAT